MNLAAINTHRRLTLLLSLAASGWFALIYLLSSRPAPEIINQIEGLDKLAHLAIYGVFGLLLYGLVEQLNKQTRVPVLPVTLLLAAAAGIFDELHQLATPGRNFSLYDLAADIGGAAMAIFLFNVVIAISERNARLTRPTEKQ